MTARITPLQPRSVSIRAPHGIRPRVQRHPTRYGRDTPRNRSAHTQTSVPGARRKCCPCRTPLQALRRWHTVKADIFSKGKITVTQQKRQRQPSKQTRQRNYKSYLGSPRWKAKRETIMKKSGGTCRICGAPATEVHHVNYERRGKERLTDLTALCRECHELYHAKLEEKKKHEASKTRKTARTYWRK